MKIIDAHTHFSNVQAFHGAADDSGVDFSYHGMIKEQAECGIVASVCMGLVETVSWAFPDAAAPAFMPANPPILSGNGTGAYGENPAITGTGLPGSGEQDAHLHSDCPPTMHVCMGINPHTLTEERVAAFAKLLKTHRGRIVGFKIYAGYYHFNINDPVYTPVYKLAAEHGLTVAIHTGDTYSETGLLEYSHPLAADRLAVNFRDVNFMLCHMGDPWVMDACEVAYKNRNIYLDISGLQAGDANLLTAVEGRPHVMHLYTQGLSYLNAFEKVLFGTDWPLVPLGPYIEFCKKIVPAATYEDVFYNNAVRLFKIG
ncbi:MAG: amidohydrolase family protein [Defluviitaleaceae bacterium]|nr:amidohydrolase family protein [Defluviitaleaceae bacterium]